MAKKLSPKEELKALQKVWYKKLEDSGFKDIEDINNNIKVWPSISQRSQEYIEANTIYYRMANHFLVDYDFGPDIIDKVIWEYHANGISIRDIADALHRAKIKRTGRLVVHKTIQRLQAEMYKLYKVENPADKKDDSSR
jgi:hypothetical protein